MNKKLLTIVLVLALGALALYGYNTFLAPSGDTEAKSVTVEIAHAEEDIDRQEVYGTDHEFLLALLEEHQEDLGASFQKFDFGVMVTGLSGYMAKEADNEYWHLTIDGVDAVTGPGEVPLIDGQTYRFELRTW